ncbi:MAG: extracellular solute-binding protein [Coprobacillus sp.]|nr:extracellular solute-binding protein [Coprobacillus sp.]
MKKVIKKCAKIAFITLILGSSFSLASCNSAASGEQTLRLLNWEDYIYEQDISSGYTAEDLVDQFIDYVKDDYPNVRVVYDTTDTNETMYNELMTGKSQYDLICPSDYMMQRMLAADLLEPIYPSENIPNYNHYASPTIRERLDEITTVNTVTGEEESLADYAVGYMWGTLGILFNPEYSGFKSEEGQVYEDMKSWSVLWNEDYKKTISIKDSMRDTYAAALMYTFDEELTYWRSQYTSGLIDSDKYNEELTKIFNRCDQDSIDLISDSLDSLKKNIFGLEVDSGKEDIVTGKIGINLAWTGDAVYSMDQADDPEQVSNPFELCYAIPENGANIWFDGWVMPKNENRSDDQYELALLWLDFISDPDNAAQNMDYIGYTSFIGGDSVLELVRDWYDYRTDLIYYNEDFDDDVDDEKYEYYDYVYYLDDDNEEVEVDYLDCHFEEDSDPDFNPVLYAVFEDGTEAGEIGYYNDRLILPADIEEVDLSYFFKGTLEEYSSEDMIFYSDEYLPYGTDEEDNISVGRQFYTQYPDEETIIRGAVMQDYGDNNELVLKMWEEFKSDPLPTWAIIVFVVEIAAIVGVLIWYFASRKHRENVRKKIKNGTA